MATSDADRHDRTMTAWWLDFIREQERAGFADVRGAQASVHLPVSDRLISRLITERLPSSGTVREIELEALEGNQCRVRLRLRPAFLPSINARLAIEGQPRLPDSPVLTARLVSKGLAALLSGPLAGAFRLPRGITLADDLLRVDLAALAQRNGADAYLAFLTKLELVTEPGRIVVNAAVALPAST